MNIEVKKRASSAARAVLALGLAVGFGIVSGCGNLTAGGFGEVGVSMSGDAPDGAGNDQLTVAYATRASESSTQRDDPEGEIEAEFTLALVTQDGGSVALTRQPVRLELDVEGSVELDAVRTTVPAARYSALRVIFTDFEIEIDDGLIVGGVPIVGGVEVELEDGTLPVERSLSLTVVDGDVIDLLIDLNTAVWLQAVDPDLRTVAEAVVGDAITVVLR